MRNLLITLLQGLSKITRGTKCSVFDSDANERKTQALQAALALLEMVVWVNQAGVSGRDPTTWHLL